MAIYVVRFPAVFTSSHLQTKRGAILLKNSRAPFSPYRVTTTLRHHSKVVNSCLWPQNWLPTWVCRIPDEVSHLFWILVLTEDYKWIREGSAGSKLSIKNQSVR